MARPYADSMDFTMGRGVHRCRLVIKGWMPTGEMRRSSACDSDSITRWGGGGGVIPWEERHVPARWLMDCPTLTSKFKKPHSFCSSWFLLFWRRTSRNSASRSRRLRVVVGVGRRCWAGARRLWYHCDRRGRGWAVVVGTYVTSCWHWWPQRVWSPWNTSGVVFLSQQWCQLLVLMLMICRSVI